MNRPLAALVGSIAASLLLAAPASAHATFVGSDPADGTVLTAAPTKVTLTFDDTLEQPGAMTVVGPGGRVDDANAAVTDRTVSTAVNIGTSAAGQYVVTYRVISDDGHPVSGTIHFTYAPAGTASSAAAPAAVRATTSKSSHGLIYAGAGLVALIAIIATVLSLRRRQSSS